MESIVAFLKTRGALEPKFEAIFQLLPEDSILLDKAIQFRGSQLGWINGGRFGLGEEITSSCGKESRRAQQDHR